MLYPQLTTHINEVLQKGCVIPAHPLALTAERKLDEAKQRGLTRYYMQSGAGGVAVGVHTTQFEIREPRYNLLKPVLQMASEEIQSDSIIKVAGICGPVDQAIQEAELAMECNYHLGLLSNGGLQSLSEKELIDRSEKIAEIIPLFGFYLQPAVGGRYLSYDFWKDFASIPNVQAIKIAAFNRYQTLDVVRAICTSDRRNEIALYTGNDDNIVADLLTPFVFEVEGKKIEKRIVGGLLGHWAVKTREAVELFNRIQLALTQKDGKEIVHLLAEGVKVTEFNAAVFDVVNNFKGCIPGIHEVLRRDRLLDGTWCLQEHEVLSKGQSERIDTFL